MRGSSNSAETSGETLLSACCGKTFTETQKKNISLILLEGFESLQGQSKNVHMFSLKKIDRINAFTNVFIYRR